MLSKVTTLSVAVVVYPARIVVPKAIVLYVIFVSSVNTNAVLGLVAGLITGKLLSIKFCLCLIIHCESCGVVSCKPLLAVPSIPVPKFNLYTLLSRTGVLSSYTAVPVIVTPVIPPESPAS